jgi:Flp pilus assembly protein TadD
MATPEFCSCGSGLRAIHCCSLDETLLPDEAAAALLEPQGVEATKLFNDKKHGEAEALALKVLALAPQQRLSLRVLYEIRKAQNRKPAAEALARRLAKLPGNGGVVAAANLQLAQLLIGDGRYADALPAAETAIIATPKDASAQHVLGVALTETGRLAAGERHYRLALAYLGREDGLVMANLAWNLKLQGRLEDAAKIYERALTMRADNKRAVGGFAQVHMARGEWDKAVALLDSGLAQWPGERTLRLLRTLADIHLGAPNEALARLGEAPEQLLASEMVARGQAFARLDKPAEAIQSYALAKKFQRERQGLSYQPQIFVNRAEQYKAYFTSERFSPLPRAGAPLAKQPVFILGFPRSGSSLLEQLLAQVEGFSASDEIAPVGDFLSLLPRLVSGDKPYPELLDRLLVDEHEEVIGQLRAKYFAPRTRLAGPYVTDRAASNIWHLGLIKLLFPEAPIIHVLRHPFDVMLSNLGQDRKLEGNCGVSIAATARHYDTMMGMLKFYRGQLTLRYLPVKYEDLVTAPTQTLRRVVDFIGAPGALPDEAALAANAGPLPEPPPAHIVAREKMHFRGLYRFRAYREAAPALFTDVSDILRPWVAELGYGDGS